MHSFWKPAFEPLQALTVACLVEDGVHFIHPLLAVNRSLRALAVSAMLRRLRVKAKVYKSGLVAEPPHGAFLEIHQAVDTFDQPIALEPNDPRELFAPDYSFMVDEDEDMDEKKRESVCLFMSDYDLKTMLVTLKPLKKHDTLST
ncbi:hypothetical protein JCM8547_005499 [Rhodosporidiobolus lusitaniae]